MSMTANSQRGVALLTILLLVVSITVVAGAMLASQKVAIRRSGLLFVQNQLMQDIHAGEQLAVMAIRADNQLNDTDSSADIWAQPLPPYAIGAHSVSVQIRDEASRFNINNLYHDGRVDTAALGVFSRLLTQLNLKPELATAVLDWQDADSEVYLDGGDERTIYAQQGDTQTMPNQPFVSVEALQNVRGIDAQVLATLQPYLTAVPFYLPINVNTASPVLLAALMEGGAPDQMQAVTQLRAQSVIESVDDIWRVPPLMALSEEQRQALTPLLAVDSQAFSSLIVATNSDSDPIRQRFATALIRKTRERQDANAANTGSNANNDANSTANNTANNTTSQATNNNDDESKKHIALVSQRLWPYQPTF